MSRLKYKSTFLSDQQKTINISIGARLRQARLGRKILIEGTNNFRSRACTQQELSLVLDCTFQQIQKYEHGTNTFPLIKMHLASKYLNIPVSEFLNIYELSVYLKDKEQLNISFEVLQSNAKHQLKKLSKLFGECKQPNDSLASHQDLNQLT
mgnify:FL=1|tara:strand:- start:419 stop:874 length:456 start_codon:yes stop_codon:yes gene_type:complete